MFFEVKVYYPKNNKKKIISSKELSHNHWVDFEERKKRFSTKILNKDLNWTYSNSEKINCSFGSGGKQFKSNESLL